MNTYSYLWFAIMTLALFGCQQEWGGVESGEIGRLAEANSGLEGPQVVGFPVEVPGYDHLGSDDIYRMFEFEGALFVSHRFGVSKSEDGGKTFSTSLDYPAKSALGLEGAYLAKVFRLNGVTYGIGFDEGTDIDFESYERDNLSHRLYRQNDDGTWELVKWSADTDDGFFEQNGVILQLNGRILYRSLDGRPGFWPSLFLDELSDANHITGAMIQNRLLLCGAGALYWVDDFSASDEEFLRKAELGSDHFQCKNITENNGSIYILGYMQDGEESKSVMFRYQGDELILDRLGVYPDGFEDDRWAFDLSWGFRSDGTLFMQNDDHLWKVPPAGGVQVLHKRNRGRFLSNLLMHKDEVYISIPLNGITKILADGSYQSIRTNHPFDRIGRVFLGERDGTYFYTNKDDSSQIIYSPDGGLSFSSNVIQGPYMLSVAEPLFYLLKMGPAGETMLQTMRIHQEPQTKVTIEEDLLTGISWQSISETHLYGYTSSQNEVVTINLEDGEVQRYLWNGGQEPMQYMAVKGGYFLGASEDLDVITVFSHEEQADIATFTDDEPVCNIRRPKLLLDSRQGYVTAGCGNYYRALMVGDGSPVWQPVEGIGLPYGYVFPGPKALWMSGQRYMYIEDITGAFVIKDSEEEQTFMDPNVFRAVKYLEKNLIPLRNGVFVESHIDYVITY